MTTQSYQPQVNLTAVEPAAREKWRLSMLVALAVLGACALVFMYYRWFGNVQPGASNEVGVSTPDTTAEKPGHVSLAKSRRASSKHRADAVVSQTPDPQLTLAPGISESAIRSPLAVEVISSDGQRQMIGTRNDSIYLGLHDKTPPLMWPMRTLGMGGPPWILFWRNNRRWKARWCCWPESTKMGTSRACRQLVVQRFFLLQRVKPSSNGALSLITRRNRRSNRRPKLL